MQQLADEQKKQVYAECLAVMQAEYYSARQFNEAAFKIAETRAYETAGYYSFEGFLSTKFVHAFKNTKRMYQLCKFAEVVEDVTKFVEKEILQIPVPTNESQTRALAPLPHEDRGPAYALAFEEAGGVPTGAEVASTVAALRPATDERIGRLDTDRKAKPPPEAPKRARFGRGFTVSSFKYDAGSRRVHFEVFKPANPFKGYEAKKENLSIDMVDLEWELRNIGFDLRPITDSNDGPGPDQSEPTEPAAAKKPKGMDPGVREHLLKEQARLEAIGAPVLFADRLRDCPDDDEPLQGSFIKHNSGIAAEAMAKLFADEYSQDTPD